MRRDDYLECEKCGFTKYGVSYHDVKIIHKKGIPTSQIKYKYCDSCQTYTRWFWGEGELYVNINLIKNIRKFKYYYNEFIF